MVSLKDIRQDYNRPLLRLDSVLHHHSDLLIPSGRNTGLSNTLQSRSETGTSEGASDESVPKFITRIAEVFRTYADNMLLMDAV